VNFLLKAKELISTRSKVRYFLIFFILFFSLVTSAVGQERPRTLRAASPSDTVNLSRDRDPADVSGPADTLINKTDTIKVTQSRGDIETTIDYSARDSIRASVDGKMVWLYGAAKIVYGDIELEAEEITIDYGKNTLTAVGKRDSLGQRIGYPIFKNGAELYETKDIVYNFKTRRARISEVVTQQGEGYLHADAAFKNEQNEILSVRNSYTTCNLEHPHFRIRSTKTKAIPNDKIVSGPFYMEFNDIPLPAAFLFGMFPAKQTSTSGILFPSYGEEKRRGFNLRGLGYYFDINEYIKLDVRTDIYSKGGHAIQVMSPYVKRYKYNGSFNFAYSKNPDTDDRIETNNPTTDFRLGWSHSPQSKGTGRFAASVNAATATFTRNNNLMTGNAGEIYTSQLNQITAKLSSNISYSKRFTGTPFSMGLNMSHNQDLQSKIVDLQLPTLSVNMTNIYPFQGKNPKQGVLDNFSVSYTMNAANRITNNLGRIPVTATRDSIAPFTVSNFSTFFGNGRKGARHVIPISTSLKAMRYFTLSPSVSYEEKWYAESYRWKYDTERQSIVRSDTVREFSRIANYNFSVGMNTRIYGMYNIRNPERKLKAIRHVMNPSVSFAYSPDFTRNQNYFDSVRNLRTGLLEYKSRHEGLLYGGSSTSQSGSIGFSLGNNLEMKVRGEKDSVARKVMLLNNFSLSTRYDLLAEKWNLSPIGIAANTNILDNMVNLNFSATLDPYAVNVIRTVDPERPSVVVKTEERSTQLAWSRGRVGRITNATLNLSTNLNPKARNKENTSRKKIAESDLPDQEKQFLLANPDAYVDFEIPWSLNLGYNVSYSNPLNSVPRIVQHLQMSGDLSISEAWKITYSSGFDFERKEFTPTSLGITRDLHCWTMRLHWVPFGRFQQYNFTINVKASVLQDLKMERRKPFLDSL
jgi:hypothetical protein